MLVGGRERHDDTSTATGPQAVGYERHELRIGGQDRTKQRAPRQDDAQLVDATHEGGRQPTCVRSQEDRIGQAALALRSRGSRGRVAGRRRVGVDADAQAPRVGARRGDDSCAVAAAQLDEEPLVLLVEVVELADVHVVAKAADDLVHGPHATAAAIVILAGVSSRPSHDPSGPRAPAIDARQLAFMAARRTATLATLSENGTPRLVPICFVVTDTGPGTAGTLIWSPLDAKPKRVTDVRRLARVRDIEARPDVTLLFERWSEDWSRLAWLRAAGRADVVDPDDEGEAHRRAAEALRAKYPQYRRQPIGGRPMIRIDLTSTAFWAASPARSTR